MQKSTAKKDVARRRHAGPADGPMLWVDHVAGHHYITLGSSLSAYLDSGAEPGRRASGSTSRRPSTGRPPATTSTASRWRRGPSRAAVGSSNTWRIGAYGGRPGGFFDGVVDDVRIYNRALSAGEIQFDRDHGVVPPPRRRTRPHRRTRRLTATAASASQPELGRDRTTSASAYNVHRSTTAGFAPSAANRSPADRHNLHRHGLGPGTYYYKVTAEDAAQRRPASNEACHRLRSDPAERPGTLTATGGFGQASLSWGAATDNVGVVRYNVHRSTTSGFTPSTANRIAQPTGTSYTTPASPPAPTTTR